MSGENNDPGYVPWWDWQKGRRPPGWTAKDEERWQGTGPWPKPRKQPEPPASPGHEGGLGPEFEALLHRIDAREAEEAERGIRNWLLAPTLELYHALQAGEAVPIDRLNQDAVKRYGLRK